LAGELGLSQNIPTGASGPTVAKFIAQKLFGALPNEALKLPPVAKELADSSFSPKPPPAPKPGLPLVSFDFDGVMHKSVKPAANYPGHNHTVKYSDIESYPPHVQAQETLKKLAEAGYPIVIVTARNLASAGMIWQYLQKYDLPVNAIYFTNSKPKQP